MCLELAFSTESILPEFMDIVAHVNDWPLITAQLWSTLLTVVRLKNICTVYGLSHAEYLCLHFSVKNNFFIFCLILFKMHFLRYLAAVDVL